MSTEIGMPVAKGLVVAIGTSVVEGWVLDEVWATLKLKRTLRRMELYI